MPNIRLLIGALALATSLAISLGAGSAGAASDIEVGAAAKVVNRVYGTPESTRQPRWWNSGLDVFHNETVVTQEVSASRVIFRDQSQLSIGPTSQLKLDSFVYDPNRTASAVSISFVRGVFRFVSGSQAKNYQIKTPATSIGVRGTVFTVYILQSGAEYIAVESGMVSVTCSQGVNVLLTAGQMTYIPSRLGSPRTPQRAVLFPAVAQMDTLLQ
jgi:hypothetical protein